MTFLYSSVRIFEICSIISGYYFVILLLYRKTSSHNKSKHPQSQLTSIHKVYSSELLCSNADLIKELTRIRRLSVGIPVPKTQPWLTEEPAGCGDEIRTNEVTEWGEVTSEMISITWECCCTDWPVMKSDGSLPSRIGDLRAAWVWVGRPTLRRQGVELVAELVRYTSRVHW